jgi:predicted Zn-dependent protease
MTRSQIANFASIPLIFVGGGIGYAARSAAALGLPMTFLTFSRGFEEEADYLAIQYLYATGYDPEAYVSFFEKIQAKEKKKTGTLANYCAFSTHPQTPDRIQKTQEHIATILPPRIHYVVNTSEFEDTRTRLALLQNRRRVESGREEKRPTLRRTTDQKDNKSDDRPTLKRRDDV